MKTTLLDQPLDAARAQTLAAAFKALGDETRLGIVALLLAADELCVCRFEELLGITQSKASRHLRYLSHAGLLTGRRDGVWVHYRIAEDLEPGLRAIVDSVRKGVGEEEFARLAATLADGSGPGGGGSCSPSTPEGDKE